MSLTSMELDPNIVVAALSGIIGAVIFFVITQFHLRYTRKAIEEEGRARQTEIITHFDGELEELQSNFQTSLTNQGREFKATVASSPPMEELTANLQALKDAYNESMTNLPGMVGEQVKAVINGMKGWDVKETQMMMDRASEEGGLDEAMSLGEAYMTADPEQMQMSFLKRLNEMTLGQDYIDENPVKALIFEAVKAQVASYTQNLNVLGMGTSPASLVRNGYRSLGQ